MPSLNCAPAHAKSVDAYMVAVSANLVCRNLLSAREVLKTFGEWSRVVYWIRDPVDGEHGLVSARYVSSSTFKPLQIQRSNYASSARLHSSGQSEVRSPKLLQYCDFHFQWRRHFRPLQTTSLHFTSLHVTRFLYCSGATRKTIPLLTCLCLSLRDKACIGR
jgi:hypothetical protein